MAQEMGEKLGKRALLFEAMCFIKKQNQIQLWLT